MDKRKIEKTKDELKTLYDILNNLPGLKKSKKAVMDAVNCIEELEVKSEKKNKIINAMSLEIIDSHKTIEYHHLDENYEFCNSDINEVKQCFERKIENG